MVTMINWWSFNTQHDLLRPYVLRKSFFSKTTLLIVKTHACIIQAIPLRTGMWLSVAVQSKAVVVASTFKLHGNPVAI